MQQSDPEQIVPGTKVRVRGNPARVGIVGTEVDGSRRRRVLVMFQDGTEDFMLEAELEPAGSGLQKPYELIRSGRFAGGRELRSTITFHRLSGKLANLIYSLNTTNTEFLPYQFKPVLNFLDSPSRGILVADEVGLGKTIEAGLIWTELRARTDAKRLLVVCPAMLCDKWQEELANRFGVNAEICKAEEVLNRLTALEKRPYEGFALVASLQGLRPPRGYSRSGQSGAAQLARYLESEKAADELFDLVIIDEAHYLRNPETRTNRLGQLLRPAAENMVMLSATPVQIRSRDLYTLLNLLDRNAFPFESAFEETLSASIPLTTLRDRLLSEVITQGEFTEALTCAQSSRLLAENRQLEHLRQNPPTDQELSSARERTRLAESLDRVSPFSKVISRTTKREVQKDNLVRYPTCRTADMSEVEAEFYSRVTERVREYCSRRDLATGFLLTIPQRQMCSCMAAACQAWQERLLDNKTEHLEEILNELDEDDPEAESVEPGSMGSLVRELVAIAQDVGDFDVLKAHDSKYRLLLEQIRQYGSNYPGKKVVLFAFHRATLRYLDERLSEDGVSARVLHGGMDKQEKRDVLRDFRDSEEVRILLSSEVAAEGVDLQFCSVVANYDLPWNPMRLEQRIGRIDRIGQEEERILIWNFIYSNTVDEKVYDRLLVRLDLFREALGSMEAMVGERIRGLTVELLGHHLTSEEEQQRIDQAALAIENIRTQERRLEKEASQLIAHGELIQNKVRAAQELGRYIRSVDLYAYLRDFLSETFEGSRLVPMDTTPQQYRVELDPDARMAFSDFVEANRLHGQTALLQPNPPPVVIENRVGPNPGRIERITQEHPIIRFVTDYLKAHGEALTRYPVHALRIPAGDVPGIAAGTYIYAVHQWSVAGALDFERLEYVCTSLESDLVLDSESAELLVNGSALNGEDWQGAAQQVDCVRAAEAFEICRELLEEQFVRFREEKERENRDRLAMMVQSLENRRTAEVQRLDEQIARARAADERRAGRILPALTGRRNAINQRTDDRIHDLRRREHMTVDERFVAGGVIRLE